MDTLALSFADIESAQQQLRGVAHKTPVFTSQTANQRTGGNLFFKCENFQRGGAFKFRGAYNAMAKLTPEQLACGVVAYSSGNHAQAISISARLLGGRATIVMPDDAPQSKLEATRGYGSEVVLYDRQTGDRDAIGRHLAETSGAILIPSSDHPHVIAGQGTVALELLAEVGELDLLITPLGGGGLLSGCAVAAKMLNPHCRVIGVEPEAGNDGQQSFRNGKIVRIAPPQTLADGARTPYLGQYTFPVIRALVDDIVTVSDRQLVEAMAFFAERMKMVLEPTACLSAAAVFVKHLDVRGKNVGIVLSGGNIDLHHFASLLGQA